MSILKTKNMFYSGIKTGGFTLIEIIITTVIVSFGFTLLLKVLSMAMSADKYFEYRNTALSLVNEKMEEITNTAFNAISSHSENSISGFVFVDERRTTVSLFDGDGDGFPDSDLKKVAVEVYWTQKGVQYKVNSEMLVCDY